MNRIIGFTPLLLGLLVPGMGLVGCQSSPSSSLDEAEVRAYADTATETCMQGLSDHDLAKYVEFGNDEFKAAVTQEVFDPTATQLSNQLGDYQSIEFLRAEEHEGYIIVHYKATFAKGPVGIRMVFDQDHLIAGQWFE
jgi:transcriptional regulator of nitric oxide reductase